MEPSPDLPLSHVDLLVDPCNKKELCADDSLIPLPQQVNELDTYVFNSHSCAENKHAIHITIANDKLKLMSSLNI